MHEIPLDISTNVILGHVLNVSGHISCHFVIGMLFLGQRGEAVMLHLAQKIVSFFVAQKLIPAQDYEWAVYGLQRRLLAVVFYPILFMIGLLVSDIYSTILFFVIFTSLRHRIGGHHADSAVRCLANSSLIVLCGLCLYPQITVGWQTMMHSLVGMAASLVIGVIGPCNDPHIVMTPEELDRNRKRMVRELIVLAAAFSALPLLPSGDQPCKTAAAASILAAGMLIAGKIQNGGFTHEQE